MNDGKDGLAGMKSLKLMLAVVGSAAMVGGCTTTRNERSWIGQTENGGKGGTVYLDLVRADERPEGVPTDDQPSTTSLSRANWQPVLFSVPADGVATHLTYANETFLTHDTARQRGDFPTATTAIELSGNTRMEQALEAPLNLGITALDMLLMPARMVVRWPTREVYSFPQSYWRGAPTTLRRPIAGSGAVGTSSDVTPPGEAEISREVETHPTPAVAPPTTTPTDPNAGPMERPEAPPK